MTSWRWRAPASVHVPGSVVQGQEDTEETEGLVVGLQARPAIGGVRFANAVAGEGQEDKSQGTFPGGARGGVGAGGRRGCARGSQRTLDAGGIGFAGTRGQSQEAQASQAATGTREPKGKDQTRFPGRRPSRLTPRAELLKPRQGARRTHPGVEQKNRAQGHAARAHERRVAHPERARPNLGRGGPHVEGFRFRGTARGRGDGRADVRGEGERRRGRRAGWTRRHAAFGSLASGMYRGAPSAARRRWYLAEHFYSSIDRSWFKADGYRPWLEHIGLGKEEKFNKRDWLVIRAALGKPRRLSLPFLRSERTRLELHRVAIRHRWHEQIQEQIRNGPPPSLNDAREKKEKEKESAADDVKKEGGTDVASIAALADGEAKSSAEKAAKASAEDDDEITDAELKAELAKLVPKDCPKPLCVGDRVVARHPKFLNVHVGTILWGPWNPKIRLCRVQFDRIELGAELVRDFHIAHLPASADPVALEENNKAQEKEEPVTPGGQRAREQVLAATEANVALAAANAAMAAASAVAAAAAAAAAAVADGDTDAENAIPLSTDAPETAANPAVAKIVETANPPGTHAIQRLAASNNECVKPA